MSTPALRVNGVKYGPNDVNVCVMEFGAKGDNSTDDTAAIQAAINAVAANHLGMGYGGTIYFPSGTYICASALNLKGLHNITLLGAGNSLNQVNPSSGPSILMFTGTGAGSFLQLDGANSMVLEKLGIMYNSASFTGVLVDFAQHSQTNPGIGNIVDRCYLGSNATQTIWSADALISLNSSYGNTIRNSILGFAHIGVRFRDDTTHASNANTVSNNWFANFQTAGVVNAAFGCNISNNVFERNVVGLGAPAMFPAYKDTLGSAPGTESFKTAAFSFMNNWIGDGDLSTFIFDGGINPILGGTITGNFFGGQVKFFSMNGVHISGNTFVAASNPITFDNSTGVYVGVALVNNNFLEATTIVTPPATGLTQWGNQLYSAATGSNDKLEVNGYVYSSTTPVIRSNAADGAAAVAAASDTGVNWANGTAKLFSFRNNNVEKSYIRGDGSLVANGAFVFATTVQALGGNFDTQSAIALALGGVNANEVDIGKTTTAAKTLGGRIHHRTAVADVNYTAVLGDEFIGYSSLSAGRTVTLPGAVTAGTVFIIKNESAGAFAITIQGASGTVDGAASVATTAAARAPAVRVYSDGTNYFTF